MAASGLTEKQKYIMPNHKLLSAATRQLGGCHVGGDEFAYYIAKFTPTLVEISTIQTRPMRDFKSMLTEAEYARAYEHFTTMVHPRDADGVIDKEKSVKNIYNCKSYWVDRYDDSTQITFRLGYDSIKYF